jgi:hypothetical protein
MIRWRLAELIEPELDWLDELHARLPEKFPIV